MGNILSFVKQISSSGITKLDKKYEVFLDFENDSLDNSDLSEDEQTLANDIEAKLSHAIELLANLKSYGSGGRQIIKEANSNSHDSQAQETAWNKMLPLVDSLLQLKQAADDLNAEVPRILEAMMGRKNMMTERSGRESSDLVNMFRTNMFLSVQLGLILDYAMRFDALKQTAPSIANDIRFAIDNFLYDDDFYILHSYVKRQSTLRSRRSGSNEETYKEAMSTANLESLSWFYIEPIPVLKSVIKTVQEFCNKGSICQEQMALIVSFAKVCIKILDSDLREKYKKFGTIGMIQRCMVALTLIYDHLQETGGAFSKDSPIDIRLVVNILEEEAGLKKRRTRSRIDTPADLARMNSKAETNRNSLLDLQEEARNLLTVLRYSNKHLRSNTTPKHIEQLFANIF